jgi:hypothetical protein
MERTLWTDERLDDRFAMTDQRFEELLTRMDRLEARMETLQHQMVNFAIVQFAAMLTILVTLIVRT